MKTINTESYYITNFDKFEKNIVSGRELINFAEGMHIMYDIDYKTENKLQFMSKWLEQNGINYVLITDAFRAIFQFKKNKKIVTTDYFVNYNDAYNAMIKFSEEYGVDSFSVRMIDSFLYPYEEYKKAINIREVA